MVQIKNKKIYNELAMKSLTEILYDFGSYDNRELKIEFKKGMFIHFYELIKTQEKFNVEAMMKLSRETDQESKETLKWVTKGVQIFHQIKDKLSDFLDTTLALNNSKHLIGELKVYEWQYVAFLCHLFINQLGNTKKEHRSLQNMFHVTEKIGNEIAKLENQKQ